MSATIYDFVPGLSPRELSAASSLALLRGFLVLIRFDLCAHPLGRLFVGSAGTPFGQAGLQRVHEVDDLGLGWGRFGRDLLAFDFLLNGLEHAFSDGVVIVLGPKLVVG